MEMTCTRLEHLIATTLSAREGMPAVNFRVAKTLPLLVKGVAYKTCVHRNRNQPYQDLAWYNEADGKLRSRTSTCFIWLLQTYPSTIINVQVSQDQ